MTKQRFIVSNRFDRLGGKPVPASRVVEMTEAEALYEAALGRVQRAVTNPQRIARKGRLK